MMNSSAEEVRKAQEILRRLEEKKREEAILQKGILPIQPRADIIVHPFRGASGYQVYKIVGTTPVGIGDGIGPRTYEERRRIHKLVYGPGSEPPLTPRFRHQLGEVKGIPREEVIRWFQQNPNPTDAQLHAWARSKGWKTSDVEEVVYQIVSELEFRKQLQMGIEVEKEHTDNPKVAERIARDHLKEIPDYYTRLLKMEKEAGLGEAPEHAPTISPTEIYTLDPFMVYDPAVFHYQEEELSAGISENSVRVEIWVLFDARRGIPALKQYGIPYHDMQDRIRWITGPDPKVALDRFKSLYADGEIFKSAHGTNWAVEAAGFDSGRIIEQRTVIF